MPDVTITICEGAALGLIVHFLGMGVSAMVRSFQIVADD